MKSKGLTVVELMVGMVALFVLGVIAAAFMGVFKIEHQDVLRDNMQKYSVSMGYTFLGGSCSGVDSDGDGYVSCDARVQEGVDSRAIALDCETTRGWRSVLNAGACRESKNRGINNIGIGGAKPANGGD
jgi:hypothetical protein